METPIRAILVANEDEGAFLPMKKFDLAELERAYEGK